MSRRVASCCASSVAGSPVACSRTNTIKITPSIALTESASRRIRKPLTACCGPGRPAPATAGSPYGTARGGGLLSVPRRVDHRQQQVRPRRKLHLAADAEGVGRGKQRDGRSLLLVHQLQLLGGVA